MTHARTSAKSVLLSLFLFTFCFPTLNAKTKLTAKEVIETFYKSYLTRPFDTKAKPSAPKLRFSKSFNELLKVNEKVCKEKAGTDICGWGADGDVYLFYCDESWETENDSCYATIEEAVEEAERQFGVVRQDWKPIAWPFDQTQNTACISTRPVFDHCHPILFAQHFEDDHSWVFSCGTTNSTKDAMLISMEEALIKDPSITFISDLKPGESAERPDVNSPWIHRQTVFEDTEL